MKKKRPHARTEQFINNAARTPLGAVLRHGLWKDSHGPVTFRRFETYFCFVYTLQGETVYEDDIIGERLLVPGDLLLTYPGVAHRYGNGSRGGWDEYFILFEGPLFDLWRKRKLLDARQPIIHLEPIAYWRKRLAACIEGEKGSDLASNLRRLVNLQNFITEVIAARSAPERTSAHLWLAQACRQLDSSLANPIDWNELAGSLGLSAEMFRKLFTQAMGVSPYRYRSAKIIDRACRLALDERKLGKEIAFALGFATEQHFSRRFREITGQTLRQFRRELKGSKITIPE